MLMLSRTPTPGSGVAECAVQRAAAIRHLQQTGATRDEAVSAVDAHVSPMQGDLVMAAFSDGAQRVREARRRTRVRQTTPADIDSRVSAVLASLSPTEDDLRGDVESGTACPCRVDAWREIRGLRWLAGKDET